MAMWRAAGHDDGCRAQRLLLFRAQPCVPSHRCVPPPVIISRGVEACGAAVPATLAARRPAPAAPKRGQQLGGGGRAARGQRSDCGGRCCCAPTCAALGASIGTGSIQGYQVPRDVVLWGPARGVGAERGVLRDEQLAQHLCVL